MYYNTVLEHHCCLCIVHRRLSVVLDVSYIPTAIELPSQSGSRRPRHELRPTRTIERSPNQQLHRDNIDLQDYELGTYIYIYMYRVDRYLALTYLDEVFSLSVESSAESAVVRGFRGSRQGLTKARIFACTRWRFENFTCSRLSSFRCTTRGVTINTS